MFRVAQSVGGKLRNLVVGQERFAAGDGEELQNLVGHTLLGNVIPMQCHSARPGGVGRGGRRPRSRGRRPQIMPILLQASPIPRRPFRASRPGTPPGSE